LSKDLDEVVEFIRKTKRAMQGLKSEQDAFDKLLNVEDLRERTRVTRQERKAFTYMELLGDLGGDEWGIMKEAVRYFNVYGIPLDGEQRKEAILMMRAKLGEQQSQNINVQYPTVSTTPEEPQQPEKKKLGWFRRK
jgi:hypothetical protein